MANQPAVLEFLATTRIGEKGQVTVPKQFRENLGLESGAPFAVLQLGNGLILMPQQDHFERLCNRVVSVKIIARFQVVLEEYGIEGFAFI